MLKLNTSMTVIEYYGEDIPEILREYPNAEIPSGEIKNGRRVGNTTRQVDKAIQLLLEGKEVALTDHHFLYNKNIPFNPTAQLLLRSISNRFRAEHRDYEVQGYGIKGNQVIKIDKL